MFQSVSYWSRAYSLPEIPVLDTDIKTDVIVVGAGISGLTTACLLLKQGMSVVVLDSGSLDSGQTVRTTGHLAYFLDDRFFELEKLFGTEGLKKALFSHKEAIDLIETLCQEENIVCDFERVEGHLFNHPDMPQDILQKDYEAAKRAEIKEVILQKSPFSFFESTSVLTVPNQAQFHPLKYIHGLVNAIKRLGGKIYRNARVVDLKGGENCQGTTEQGFRLFSNFMVVATNSPINNRFIMHTKQAAYRTYVIGGRIAKNSVPKGLYYDTLDPYHYVRIYSEKNEDILIIGGEDHKTGQENHPQNRYHKLENWSKERFPMLNNVEFFWSGQIMEPVDSLAFIGKNPLEKNVYIITGDSGNGLTHGTLGGIIIRELIVKGASPYEELYNPARKTLRSLPEFAKENANVGKEYTKWLKPAVVSSVSEIEKNSGALVQKGIEKIAVYRDPEGKLHKFSAVCPHLGCAVNWNAAEKTWDCPCHGSRFDCKGAVIEGPAVSDLKKLN